jgi:RND family efflux transporter MFP subunit
MDAPKPTLNDLRIKRDAPPASGPSPGVIIGGIIALVLIAFAVWWILRPKPIEVQIAVARELTSNGNSERTVLNASGYVTARRAATASSKVTGKVVEVLIEEGMRVGANQILARLDDTNVKASLKVAQAQWDSARKAVAETQAQLQQAELELNRAADLHRQKIASQSEFDAAEANAKTLRARLARLESEVTVAQRNVEMWQQQMDDHVIRAPFSGVVTTKNSQPGEMISPVSAGGGFTRTGIGTIVDMDSLEIEIDVNESFINRVQPGQAVAATLDAYPQWKIPCQVIAIVPTADRQKSTVKVRVGFDQLDPRILPEMAVKVAFRETNTASPAAQHQVIIPKSAVRQQEGRDIVLVAKDGRAERRAVAVNSITGDEALIGAGLTAGEKVVTNSPAGLADGVPIREAKQ